MGRSSLIDLPQTLGLMDPYPLILVVVSAFSHAAWNFFAKESDDKESYMWIMTTTSTFSLLPIYAILLIDWRLPLAAVPYMIVSALAETLYFVSLSKAYVLGDLSVVYPLARSSPLFVSILAVVFLDEKISPWGSLGILFIVFGVYTIHLKGLKPDDFFLPFRSLKGRASQFALLTALCTSVYSIADKTGVSMANPLVYSFWLEIFIFPLLTIVVLRRRGKNALLQEWRNSRVKATVSGFLMRFGYLIVLTAMSMIQISYVLALRQFSVVIGAAAGVFLLGEKYGRVRLVGSIIIFLGVYILAVLS